MGDASQSQRRTVGRKRKASGPITGEPVMQRQRNDTTPAQLPSATPGEQATLPMVLPHAGYPEVVTGTYSPAYPAPVPLQRRDSQHRQRVLYSQWANQREVIARQMDFVQSPDDEANLQRLSQNIEELRRLSQEARRS